MPETKQFSLGAVLSVTTGRLAADIGTLYKILGWMTDDSPFTHQLPRFSEECRPWLLRWFPELEAVETGTLDALLERHGDPKFAVEAWLDGLTSLPRKYSVPRIPQDDHDRKHPYDELVAMRGTDEGVVVVETPERSD